jgi:small multidrug resistance pump
MSWLLLTLAIVLEVSGTTNMKLSEGFSKVLPSIFVFVFYGLSIGALTLALNRVEVSVAYAMWSGIGTALVAVVGMLVFKEPVTAAKLGALGLIVVGVAILSLTVETH